MTPLDLISERTQLSVDEIGNILDAVNDVSFRLENNMDQFLEDRMDIELTYGEIVTVNEAFNGLQPQTPLSLVIRRTNGPNEAAAKRLLFICAYVSELVADSLQQCFDDERLDMELEEFGITEEEVKAAIRRAECHD